MENFRERVKLVRQRLGLSRVAMSRMLDRSDNFMQILETGRQSGLPSQMIFKMLELWPSININYIFKGVGEPFDTDVDSLYVTRMSYISEPSEEYRAVELSDSERLARLEKFVLAKFPDFIV
jgi:hypothetical protein